MPRPAANGGEYVRLERRLTLLAWLNSRLGYASNEALLRDVAQAAEGFDAAGRSYVYHRLVGRGAQLRLPLADLTRYDDNIRGHLAAVNRGRAEPITLRPFQHMALLYAELYLDWRLTRLPTFLAALNEFVADRNARRPVGEPAEPPFAAADLTKLAFWMATGSGKTLLMHVNYRQFLHYNRQPLDNILLITPNEGLSEQHMAEMTASGVPNARFSLAESGLGLLDKDAVRVIEISKLVEQKRGGGVSVPVEAFEGVNLVFVDEGHRGAGGEAWRRFRDALGQTGFTFEYSATFGQALTAARNDALTAEYGKAIAFDYSYKYFYDDGYGKDFHILNLRDETVEDQTDLLLLGNLLSFYEQQRCFKEEASALRPYNLDKPLWVFVGSTVNAVYTENRAKRSDVLTVARFLRRFLANADGWATQGIRQVIDGDTGLRDGYGDDVFHGRFAYLRRGRTDPQAIYQDVLASVFQAPAGGTLHLAEIRGRSGELGLKVGGAASYFGLIYIGDSSAFKKLVEEDKSGIVVEEDVMADSLFDAINAPDSPINILIGAKKFMEGWNSWRVSNMGLLNIGRSEGSEIIQLFGRGVRLRGRDFSLKRSDALDGAHPAHIRLLETLNIFAVRANYMAQFRDYLEREGVDPDGRVQLALPIHPNHGFLDRGLVIPRVPDEQVFAVHHDLALAPDAAVKVSLDLSVQADAVRYTRAGVATKRLTAGASQPIRQSALDLVDWGRVYVNLLDFKAEQGFTNLVIPPGAPRQVLAAESPLYELVADDNLVAPATFADVARLQETVVTLLRKYVEKYYRVHQDRWESRHMRYAPLTLRDPNFQDYTVRVPRHETELIEAVKQLIADGSVYGGETHDLPNILFDRHLYQPLLVERNDRVKSDPPGLNDSERRFVDDLRAYVRREAASSLADREIFLLRNLSRGKGVGFFENEGFYPDFILWVKAGDRQRIVFIEPHGMRQEAAYVNNAKARLHERLAALSQTWADQTGMDNVTLDSFIISATPYDDLRRSFDNGQWARDDFAAHHILFFDGRDGDDSYCARLF